MTDKKLKATSGNLKLGDVATVDQTNGRFGIGTANPASKFHLATTGATNTFTMSADGNADNAIDFQEADINFFRILHQGSAGGNPNNLLKIQCADGGDGVIDVDAITVTQAGNVGIGTSPGLNRFAVRAVSSTGQIAFGRTTTNQGHGVIGATGTGAFELYTGGTGTDAVLVAGALMTVSHAGAVTLGPTGATFNGTNPIHNVCGNLWFGTVTSTAYSGEFAIGVNARVSSSTGMAGRTNASTTGTAIYIANVSSNTSVDAFTIRTNNATDLTDAVAKTIMSATAAGAWTLGPSAGGVTHKANGGFAHALFKETANVSVVDYDVANKSLIVFNNTSGVGSSTLNGMTGGVDGQIIYIVNKNNNGSTVTVTLRHNNAGAAAGNKIFTPNGTDVVLGAGESAILVKSTQANIDAYHVIGGVY